jgi:hypothetical protein
MLDGREQTTEPAAGGFVQEDTLDRIGGAEIEGLLERGLFDALDR